MIRTLGVAAFVLFAGLSPTHADQLDLAKAGKLQCYQPNDAARHCFALSGYTFKAGKATNQAEIMLGASPLLVMKTVSAVTFDGDTVCGTVKKSDLDSAEFTLNGAPLDPAKSADIRAKVWSIFAARSGKMVCTNYTPNGSGFTANSTIDGKPDPSAPPATVIMVNPTDGYSVGP